MSKRCAAMAEVATPDGCLREVACGKHEWGWHTNRQVRWPGRRVKPVFLTEEDLDLVRLDATRREMSEQPTPKEQPYGE